MAKNKPVGDNERKGAVKKRTQRKTAVLGRVRREKSCRPRLGRLAIERQIIELASRYLGEDRYGHH
jgi:hypothetical protein